MSGESSRLIAAAISEAILQAEHLRADLARRLNPVSTAQRLRSEARKAAALPVAFEQLYAMALAAGAQGGSAGGAHAALAMTAARPDPLQQLEIRRLVFQSVRGELTGSDLSPFVFVAEGRRIAKAGSDPRRLAGWLRAAAELNRELWDHPQLPVELPTRQAMLACVPALAARAETHLRSLSGGMVSRPVPPRRNQPDTEVTR